MKDCVPIVLQVDCEPDPRETRHGADVAWAGVEPMVALLEEWRVAAQRATRRPVQFSWFWRADPQIAEDHGEAGWAFRRYGRAIERQLAAGDAVGLHVHCWRWDERAGGWLNDHGNRRWVAHCLDQGFAAYRSHFGRTAADFRMGDGFMDQAAFERLVHHGVRREQTLEPGRAAMRGVQPHERSTGSLPDRRAMPVAPYRPRRGAYLEAAGEGEAVEPIWVIPCTAGPDLPPGAPWPPGVRHEQSNLESVPKHFRRIVGNGMGKPLRPYGALAARSSAALEPQAARLKANLAWLLELAKQKPLRFVTAEGLLQRFGLTEAGYSAGAWPLSLLTIFSAMRARLPVRPRR